MNWRLTNRVDVDARQLADRHYNRQNPGHREFCPPGRVMVLVSGDPVDAVWVTSWPFAQHVQHAWAGAWVNSLFRNEGRIKSSDLIREAVSVTRWFHGYRNTWKRDPAPELGMITFVDPAQVHQDREDHVPGYCYRRAKFRRVGVTKTRGFLAFQLTEGRMPAPQPPAPPLLFGGNTRRT